MLNARGVRFRSLPLAFPNLPSVSTHLLIGLVGGWAQTRGGRLSGARAAVSAGVVGFPDGTGLGSGKCLARRPGVPKAVGEIPFCDATTLDYTTCDRNSRQRTSM